MDSPPFNLGWECTCVYIHPFIIVCSFHLHVWRALCQPGLVTAQLPQIDLDAYRMCLFQNPTLGSLLYTSLSLVFGAQGFCSGSEWTELTGHRSRGVLGRTRTNAGPEIPVLQLKHPKYSRHRHQRCRNVFHGHLLLPPRARSHADFSEGTYSHRSLDSNLLIDLAF